MFYGFTAVSYILNSNSFNIVSADIKPVLLIMIDVAFTMFVLMLVKTMQTTVIKKAKQEVA